MIDPSVDDDSITLLDAILLHDQHKNVSWLEQCGRTKRVSCSNARDWPKTRAVDTIPNRCTVHVRNQYLRRPNGMEGYLSPTPLKSQVTSRALTSSSARRKGADAATKKISNHERKFPLRNANSWMNEWTSSFLPASTSDLPLLERSSWHRWVS